MSTSFQYNVYLHQSRTYVVKIAAGSDEEAIEIADELFDCDNSGFEVCDVETEGFEAVPAGQ